MNSNESSAGVSEGKSRRDGGRDGEDGGSGRVIPGNHDYIPLRLPILALCLKEHIDRATLSHRPRDLTRQSWLLFERYVPSSCNRSMLHDARDPRWAVVQFSYPRISLSRLSLSPSSPPAFLFSQKIRGLAIKSEMFARQMSGNDSFLGSTCTEYLNTSSKVANLSSLPTK